MKTLILIASVGVGLNFLAGLLMAMLVAPKYRRSWLRNAPSFSMFVLGLTIWPAWCVFDLVYWWRSRR